MDEKRKSDLVVAALKMAFRKRLAIREIANLSLEVDEMVKEPEMIALGASTEELLELTRGLVGEVLEEQMRAIQSSS